MNENRWRWLLLLAPFALPWVIVSWDGGFYTMFAWGWIDPGVRVVSVVEFVQRSAMGLGTRTFTAAYPLAGVLYLAGVVSARVGRDPIFGAVTAAIFILSGLNVVFFAYGVNEQSGITGIPLGALWLWGVAALFYRDFYRGSNSE